MLKLSTTTALKSLIKKSSSPQLRFINSSKTPKMACVYQWPRYHRYHNVFRHSSHEENSIHKQVEENSIRKQIEEQKQINKSYDAFYEQELCEAQSLLAYLYEKSDKSKLDTETIKKIETHLLEHKAHRVEEHHLVIKWIEQAIAALKNESSKKESKALEKDLKKLKEVDVNSTPFLYERELQLNIAKKLKR